MNNKNILIILIACFFCKQSVSQFSKRVSYGFQIGMVAYEKTWNAYAPSSIPALRYSSIDLLPIPKIGFMSEYNFSKRWAIDFSPSLTIQHTFTRGGTSLAQNNTNLFTLRSVELPMVSKFYVPVTKIVKWSVGAGMGVDFIPKKWQIKGPMTDYWDSYGEGGPYPATFSKAVTDQLLIDKAFVPFISLQTGVDIKLKNKGCFYIGAEGHLQTVKNFNLKRSEQDYVASTKREETGPAFNTNYFLVKVGYWLRKN